MAAKAVCNILKTSLGPKGPSGSAARDPSSVTPELQARADTMEMMQPSPPKGYLTSRASAMRSLPRSKRALPCRRSTLGALSAVALCANVHKTAPR
eukprot:2604567-Pleurochrysis_carterae.AAC.5